MDWNRNFKGPFTQRWQIPTTVKPLLISCLKETMEKFKEINTFPSQKMDVVLHILIILRFQGYRTLLIMKNNRLLLKLFPAAEI